MFRSLQVASRAFARSQPARTIAYKTRLSLDRIMPEGLQPLTFSSGPLDQILEIAVLITNGNLDLVDDGIEYVIRTDKAVLDSMNEWCIKQHASSGLTQQCLDSPHTTEEVEKKVFEYIRKWVPNERTGILAGNSVHADRSFLVQEMPHVSSIKELCRRWYPSVEVPKDLYEKDSSAHRALSDIRGSIRELKWYRDNIFRAPADFSRY
ncbi:ribonuclease H-like domain-containing protein [Fomitopsis serialis]|uniref:ribonuclease H-like domain-containing protein n=1 Tax=Fomitopsis serialis TaxID=139415 RepID=UPI0020087425|nr:ribonuclease H-like domain-containing protein [Neoantrodia serialis]KAH9922073.1 ribonuclease H-like domain-containing protein [Neoantrodia serialis]